MKLYLALVLAPLSFGSDLFFAPTSAGSNNGTNCANAYAYNDGTHGWSLSAQQVAGNNLHICTGTYTALGGGQLLTTANAGSNGNPITLAADQGAAIFTSTIFSTSGAIWLNKSFWTVNGSNNLTIRNTANGTGLANNAQSSALSVSGTVSGVIVENMTIQNICQRSAGDVGDSCTSGGNDTNGIQLSGTYTGLTLQGLTIAQGGHSCIFYAGNSGDASVLIQNNTISGCNWAIGGDGGSHLTISGNDITCVVAAVCNWDEVADDNHHNGIFLFLPDGVSMTNVVISNNYIHDINGNTTAYIFFAASGSTGNIPSAQIYNNVFFTTASQSGPGNGMITSGSSVNPAPLTLNNTFVGPGARAISQDSNGIIKNNIISGVGCQVYYDSGSSGITSSYNDFFGWGTPPCQSTGQGWFNGTNGFTTLVSWTSGSTVQCSGGCDATGSINTNPNLSASFTPNAGSPVIGSGSNLTGLGIIGLDTGAPQTFGANYACGSGCLSRPASGPWDIGAYNGPPTGGGSSSLGASKMLGTGVMH